MPPAVVPAQLQIAPTSAPTPDPSPAELVSPPPRPLAEAIRRVTGSDTTAEVVAWIVEPVLQVVLITAIAYVVVRLGRRFLARVANRVRDPRTYERLTGARRRLAGYAGQTAEHLPSKRQVARLNALEALARSVLTMVVWTVAVLTILGTVFGINLAPLIAGAGILGIALGFGAQDLVKDFLSGIFMLAEDQYGIGDVVDVGEATGVVEGVSLRTTRIRAVDGVLWHVPNGEIRRVGNQSQEWARALLDIGVAYGTDVDRAGGIIKRVADDMAAEDGYAALFLAEPEVWGVENLGPDAVDIRLVVKTQPGEQWAISRELRRRIKAAFDREGIEIPFPQRTVWVRGELGDAAPPSPAEPAAASPAMGKAAAEEGARQTSDQQTQPPRPEEGPDPAADAAERPRGPSRA